MIPCLLQSIQPSGKTNYLSFIYISNEIYPPRNYYIALRNKIN